MKPSRCSSLLLVFVISFVAPLLFAQPDSSLVGTAMPDLKVEFLDKAPATSGKPLLVEFWATWCPPCRDSIPHLNEIHEEFKAKGLVVIGITDEKEQTVRSFQKDLPMNYSVGIDATGALGTKLGVQGIPHAFLVDKSGKIVWAGHPMALQASDIKSIL
jgi:thiol-disulfide isomerase/thioredoxin